LIDYCNWLLVIGLQPYAMRY